jgi:Ulp1 protease family, C-terminal catalytic domain
MKYMWTNLMELINTQNMEIMTEYSDKYTKSLNCQITYSHQSLIKYLSGIDGMKNIVRRIESAKSKDELDILVCDREVWPVNKSEWMDNFKSSTLFSNTFSEFKLPVLELMVEKARGYDITAPQLILLFHNYICQSTNKLSKYQSMRRKNVNTYPFAVEFDIICNSLFIDSPPEEEMEDEEEQDDEEFGDLISLKNNEFIFGSAIEDTIIYLIEKYEKSNKIHLISNYNTTHYDIVNTVGVIPHNKILIRLLHTDNKTHWILGVISMSNNTIYILDPMRRLCKNRKREFKLLHKFAVTYQLFHDMNFNAATENKWNFIIIADSIQQPNMYDCGLYCAYYALCIIKERNVACRKPDKYDRGWMLNILKDVDVRPLIQEITDADMNSNDPIVVHLNGNDFNPQSIDYKCNVTI